MRTITKAVITALASTAALAGCATSPQGQLVFDPNQINAVLTASPGPQPVEEVYEPMPNDVYVSAVVDRDVVFVHGDTYLWVIGADGVRRRQFYAHGDHRADVFHRREELHAVMTHHEGHLPDHPVGPHDAFGHPGAGGPGRLAGHGPEQGPEHGFAGGPNHAPMGNMPVAHAPAANRAAPKPEHKDKDKKS